MKSSDVTWLDYLQQGIDHMEGTVPEGQRSFNTANQIFEECAEEADDHAVKTESHFLLAQVALYEQKLGTAREWVIHGKPELITLASANKRAQCLLIEGTLLEQENHISEALELYEDLWAMDLTDQKLRGDIAHRLARIFSKSQLGRIGIQAACEWIVRAEECLTSINSPDANVYDALALVKNHAALLFLWRSQDLWHEANTLYREGRVRNPFFRATYWRNRFRAALSSLQPLRALWYFLRFLWSRRKCQNK
jgi:hypothetical protein